MTRIPTRKALLHRKDIDGDRFVDRIVERWLFERSMGTAYALAGKRLAQLPDAPELAERLDEFRRREQLHVEMLEALLDELGHAPREMPATPAVNIAATEAEGLLELLRGRELGVEHVLEVLFAAELLDGAGWELLIDTARAADLEAEWLRSFHAAEREQAEHRHVLRQHLEMVQRRSIRAEAAPAR